MNIVSGSCLLQDSYSFKSETNGCSVYMNNVFYIHAPESNGLFLLNLDCNIRVLLSLAASYGLLVHQMDVKTTFLNGELEEEIYMDKPDGFVVKGEETKVCKLVKSLYGLKQIGRAHV